MKKILIISGSLPPIRCGVGEYTHKLVQELAAEGINFELLSTDGVDGAAPAPLQTIPNWKITNLPKMLKAIRRTGAEIVHIQYPAVGYRRQLGINLLPYALRLLRPRLKIIITLHEYHQSRWVGRLRNRLTIWPAHRVIVSNQTDSDILGKKTAIIPIGANFDVAAPDPAFYRQMLQAHHLDPAKPALIFFGYAFPAKRLEVLLEALKEPELTSQQLLIIGDLGKETGYQKMLRQKINQLNRGEPRVGSTGFLEGDSVSKIMQASRYFIMPNSQPLSAKSSTAISAIQNSLIVISRGSKNQRATAPFEHRENCFLLEEVTPESIAAAVDSLENSAANRQRILRGVKVLQKYFSWDSIVNKHIKLYEEF